LPLKCTKTFVGCGFASDLTGGAYSAPPDPLAGFRGPTSKGGEEEEGWGGGRGEGKGMRDSYFWFPAVGMYVILCGTIIASVMALF